MPFRFPSSPDTGAGLTAAGRDLVHACNLLGIMVDVSHLNEAGFWDVAALTQAPIVATHSNAHALCAVVAQPHRPRSSTRSASRAASSGSTSPSMFLREDGGRTRMSRSR